MGFEEKKYLVSAEVQLKRVLSCVESCPDGWGDGSRKSLDSGPVEYSFAYKTLGIHISRQSYCIVGFDDTSPHWL